jgi:hypothetical protein
MKSADEIREFARRKYIEPARRRGERSVRIVAGDVHRELRFVNRVPNVCHALRSKEFLQENGLVLENWEGPPSGLSTTVVYTYRLLDNQAGVEQAESSFLQLRGIAKEVFRSLGGAEQFLRSERDSFYQPAEKAAGKR